MTVGLASDGGKGLSIAKIRHEQCLSCGLRYDTLRNTIYGTIRTGIIEPHAGASELLLPVIKSVIFSSSCLS